MPVRIRCVVSIHARIMKIVLFTIAGPLQGTVCLPGTAIDNLLTKE
jgi:hypothetical protein